MDLKQECEKTFYRELYHFVDEAQQLLMDETTKKLYLRKEKQFYDLQVYQYLKEHTCPHLANVHDFWEEDGKLIVIEEYIEGETLDSQLQKDGTLPEEEALRILKEICKGLSFLHCATPQIVHRDLKASNVMLTKDGVVKLIDYDAAKTVKEGAAKDTVLIGTEGNAAPEQYGFAQSDGRTDIYALGILMRRLFPDTPRYAHIIQKATQMDPVNRYQTVEELLSDVDAAHHAHEETPGSGGTTATIPKEAPAEDESHSRSQTSHKRIVIPLLCALLVIGIATAVLLPRVLSRQEETPGDSTAETTSAEGALSGTITQGESVNESVSGQTVRTQYVPVGSYYMTVPGDWEKNGSNYYLEKGENTAFLSVAALESPGLKRTEDIPMFESAIKQGLKDGFRDTDITRMDDLEKLTINGIDLYRFSYEGTTGLYNIGGENYLLADETGGRLLMVSCNRIVTDGTDHMTELREAVQTLEKSSKVNTYNWKQEYDDPGELVTMNGRTLIHVANIEEDTISIWWLEEETGWTALFWRGNLRTESEEDGKQILISEKEEGLDSLHSSLDTTKRFEMKDNTFTYQIWRGNDVREIRMTPVP